MFLENYSIYGQTSVKTLQNIDVGVFKAAKVEISGSNSLPLKIWIVIEIYSVKVQYNKELNVYFGYLLSTSQKKKNIA